MHLQAVHVQGSQGSCCVRSTHDCLLRGPIGGRQAAGPAILIDGSRSQERQGSRLGSRPRVHCRARARTAERCQDGCDYPLGPYVAVGRCIQGLAPAMASACIRTVMNRHVEHEADVEACRFHQVSCPCLTDRIRSCSSHYSISNPDYFASDINYDVE